MPGQKFFYKLFNIEKGEKGLVAMCFFLYFFLGIPQLFTASAASALFLEYFKAADLPLVYMSSALIVPAVGLLVTSLQKRIKTERLLPVLLFSMLLCLVLIYCANVLFGLEKLPRLVLLVWVDVEYMLTELIFWITVNTLFNIRQAKRLFGLMGAGQVVSAITGGALLPLIIRAFGTLNLIIISMLALSAACAGVFLLFRFFRFSQPSRQEQPDSKGKQVGKISGLIGNRYIRLIFLLVAFEFICHNFIDNAFFTNAKLVMPGTEQLAVFLGQFLALAGIVKLMVTALLSSRWIKRFGVLGGLSSPALLIIVPLTMAIVFSFIPLQSLAVPILLFAARFCETLFISTIYAPAYYILYQAVQEKKRARAQNIAELVVGQLAGGAAGLVLFLFSGFFTAHASILSLFALTAAFLWLMACFMVNREYKRALAQLLARRDLKSIDMIFNNADMIKTLKTWVFGQHPREIFYCLTKLKEIEDPEYPEILKELMHQAPSPVIEYIKMHSGQMDESATLLKQQTGEGELEAGLSSDDREIKKQALVQLGSESGRKAFLAALELARVPDLRQSVITAFVRTGETAIPFLEEAYTHNAGNVLLRCVIAQILGKLRTERAIKVLESLLSDTDRQVRYFVLQALKDCRYISAGDKRKELHALLVKEINYSLVIYEAVMDLYPLPKAFVLRKTLEEELRAVRSRCFYVLSLLYDREKILNILYNLQSVDPGKLSLAVELTDNLLKRPDKELILPLIEQGDEQSHFQKLSRLFADFKHESLDPENRLSRLVTDVETWQSPWISECAEYIRLKIKNPAHRKPLVEKVLLFKRTVIFRAVSHEVLFEIVPVIQAERFAPHTSIIRKGEQGSTMYVIAAGRIRVHIGEKTITEMGPGAIFGELSALSPEPRSADITCLEKSVLFPIPRDLLHDLITNYRQVAIAMLRILVSRFFDALNRIDGAVLSANHPEFPAGSTPSHNRQLTILDKVIVFHSIPLFENVPEGMLVELAHSIQQRYINKGETVYSEGEKSASLFILVEGMIIVRRKGAVLYQLGERDMFGELAALELRPREAEARAAGNTLLLEMNRNTLFDLISDQTGSVHSLIVFLIERLRKINFLIGKR
ncbi:MAG: cyclic nucleotide-binding domain-containing protein [Spirochaetales bacterium]|nr:cyclic nucleotide-binding domain-containing protein [Spirochaetales bacterium]